LNLHGWIAHDWLVLLIIIELESILNLAFIHQTILSFKYSRVSKESGTQSSGYGKSSADYKRGPFKGPRNQFGEFAFITITTDGKVRFVSQFRRVI